MINLLAFIILTVVTLVAYFMPLNGNNVLTLEMKYPNLVTGPAFVWYFYFIALFGLALFNRFQAGTMKFRDTISAKALETLGWTSAAIGFLYSLATVFLHYEHLNLTITFLVLTVVIGSIANGNIRDQSAVMEEKFWVRNPFSLFLAWSLYLLMSTIAMRWPETFSQATPALILVVSFLAFVLYFAFANMNIGLPIYWILILLMKQFQNPDSQILKTAIWVGIIFLVITVFLIAQKDPHQHYYRKPVVKGMDKYNSGQESQLEKLETELNEKLKTKPGARISLRN